MTSQVFLVSGYRDQICTEGVVFVSSARGALHCATLCSQDEACYDFTFQKGVCRGQGWMRNPCTSFAPAEGAKSFGKIRTEKTCLDILDKSSGSGMATVYPTPESPVQVYCDQDTDGGGWMVFQRRRYTSMDFNRSWVEYQEGFGDIDGEFWLGNEALHILTFQQRHLLRVDMKLSHNDAACYVIYLDFFIGNSSDNYRLHIGQLSGSNHPDGNSMQEHNGKEFTTFDRDNDIEPEFNCAAIYGNGWWFNNCDRVNLNSLRWNFDYLNSAEMKMRPY